MQDAYELAAKIFQFHRKNNILHSVFTLKSRIQVGDSAHSPLPTSGQGACQALEDAWHIANCLTEHSANIDRAFSQFTELRQAKTAAITMAGRQLASSIFNRDPLFCQQRNTASKNSDFSQLITAMAKGWSSGLPLSV